MEILKTSGFNNIYEFSCFQKEFESLFNKNIKNYNRHIEWLFSKLKILDEEGIEAIQRRDFKFLRDNIYEIRKPRSKENPRILFTILEDKSILITAILEKSSSDFKLAIEKSIKRIELVERGQ
jgi:hypothetical protein